MFVLYVIFLVVSRRPEKTLTADPVGTARMKQHERWAGMLLEKAGVQQHWHRAGLEMVRGKAFCWRHVLERTLKQHRLR